MNNSSNNYTVPSLTSQFDMYYTATNYTFTLDNTVIGNSLCGSNIYRADTIDVKSDVVIDGISMKEAMNSIMDRLAILQPDPAKLEKYAALKTAYEHYKMLERLLHES